MPAIAVCGSLRVKGPSSSPKCRLIPHATTLTFTTLLPKAGTLRSRVRGVLRFLSWLALRHDLTNPTALSQLTEYLQVRQQEPCNRGSLKGSRHSIVFLESMAGVSPQDRFTDGQLYNVLNQELLVAALPGSPAKQAPRVLTPMLVALEHLVAQSFIPPPHDSGRRTPTGLSCPVQPRSWGLRSL